MGVDGDSARNLVVGLEVVPEDDATADITDIDQVGHDVYLALKDGGCDISPAKTGTKGAQPAFDILLQLPQLASDHRDALLTLLNSLLVVFHRLLIAREKRAKQEKGRRAPITLVVKLGEKRVSLEAEDTPSATALLDQLRSAGVFNDATEMSILNGEETVQIRVGVPARGSRRPHRNPDPSGDA